MRRFERADGALLTTALMLLACVLFARWSPLRTIAGAVGALIVLGVIALLAERVPETFRLPRWYLALRALWCTAVLGLLLDLTRGLYPQADHAVIIPAVLALLAALACAKGAGAPAQVGAVCWPFALVILGVVTVFAAPDVKLARLRETGERWQSIGAFVLVLLPGMLPMRRGRASRWLFALLAIVLAAAPAVVCRGLLGRAQTGELSFPLYAAAQSISVFGVMERFEVLLSGALTLAAFCACAFVLTAGMDGLPGSSAIARHTWSLVLDGAGFAAMLWLLPRLPGWFFAAGSALFCGVLPLLLLGIGAMKNRTEKVKKPVDKAGRFCYDITRADQEAAFSAGFFLLRPGQWFRR